MLAIGLDLFLCCNKILQEFYRSKIYDLKQNLNTMVSEKSILQLGCEEVKYGQKGNLNALVADKYVSYIHAILN